MTGPTQAPDETVIVPTTGLAKLLELKVVCLCDGLIPELMTVLELELGLGLVTGIFIYESPTLKLGILDEDCDVKLKAVLGLLSVCKLP